MPCGTSHITATPFANGIPAFTSYPVRGFTEGAYKDQKDWHIWIATYSPNAIVTKGGEGAKYKTMADLLAALKAKPGEITFGTAGVGSGGYMGSKFRNWGPRSPTNIFPIKVARRQSWAACPVKSTSFRNS